MQSGCAVDLALEHEDLALRQQLAQVVIGAAVAQTELEHRPRHPADLRGGMAEARALGLQAPDEAVEATHVTFAPKVCRHSSLFEAQASWDGEWHRNGAGSNR